MATLRVEQARSSTSTSSTESSHQVKLNILEDCDDPNEIPFLGDEHVAATQQECATTTTTTATTTTSATSATSTTTTMPTAQPPRTTFSLVRIQEYNSDSPFIKDNVVVESSIFLYNLGVCYLGLAAAAATTKNGRAMTNTTSTILPLKSGALQMFQMAHSSLSSRPQRRQQQGRLIHWLVLDQLAKLSEDGQRREEYQRLQQVFRRELQEAAKEDPLAARAA